MLGLHVPVFGCFCILGGLNVANSGGNTGVIIGSLGEGIGGILMVIAASQVGCCLQLHREGATMQEMNGAQGKVNSAKGFGMVAIGLYLVSLIGWIMAVMAVLQCANKEGCLSGRGALVDVPGGLERRHSRTVLRLRVRGALRPHRRVGRLLVGESRLRLLEARLALQRQHDRVPLVRLGLLQP